MSEVCAAPPARRGVAPATPGARTSLGAIAGVPAFAAPWPGVRPRALVLELPRGLEPAAAATLVGGRAAALRRVRVVELAEGPAGPGSLVVCDWPGGTGATVADLLVALRNGGCRVPELLGLLALAELLEAVAGAHAEGLPHGFLGPSCCFLTGAPPARLLRDCPRDPRLVVAGCGVAGLVPASERRRAAAELAGTPWLAPEARDGGEPRPESDLWAAAGLARSLLAAAGAIPGAALGSLLDSLQSAPARRPAAMAAARRARALALRGLAAWDDARGRAPGHLAPQRLGDQLRYAGPAGPEESGGNPRRAVGRGARETGGHGGSSTRGIGGRRERAGVAQASPSPFVAAGAHGVAAWVTLGPAAVAGLLCLLLTAMLLLGSCA